MRIGMGRSPSRDQSAAGCESVDHPLVGITLLALVIENTGGALLGAGDRGEEQPGELRQPPDDPGDLADLARFILATGLRLGEALGVQWSDIDFDRGSLVANQGSGSGSG